VRRWQRSQIGELWQRGEITAAHEHFASAIIRDFLTRGGRGYASEEHAPCAIVATPAGQLHELGAVMVAAAASNLGWRAVYLGASLPAAEIAGAAVQNDARVVLLSIVYPADDRQVATDLALLRRLLPSRIEIVAGGRAARAYARTLKDWRPHPDGLEISATSFRICATSATAKEPLLVAATFGMENPFDMRWTAIVGLFVAGGFAPGWCSAGDAAEDIIVRSHFAGLAWLSSRPDLAPVQAILALPESQRLADAAVARLAACALPGSEPTPGNPPTPRPPSWRGCARCSKTRASSRSTAAVPTWTAGRWPCGWTSKPPRPPVTA
jgi:methylmalonyl-CoA mutase cobalamin-binding subunit